MNIGVLSIHIKDQGADPDHAIAEQQFKTLSTVPGSDLQSAYISVKADSKEDFGKGVKVITENILSLVENVRGGGKNTLQDMQKGIGASAGDTIEEQADKASKEVLSAGLVQYIGKDADRPNEITAWILDRDLDDPVIQNLDVRILLTRQQLDNLSRVLDELVASMKFS